MSVILTQVLPGITQRRGWSLEDFERAADVGLFAGEKLELIEGEVVEKMTQKPPHAWALQAMTRYLERACPTSHVVRSQLPLILEQSKPEPDVAVVQGSFNDFRQTHPTSAVLVVEISDTTLALDRTTKAALYARAGIAEYWIVNLPDRVLEIHRQPAPMTEQPLGWGYRSLTRHVEDEAVVTLTAPESSITVAELLP